MYLFTFTNLYSTGALLAIHCRKHAAVRILYDWIRPAIELSNAVVNDVGSHYLQRVMHKREVYNRHENAKILRNFWCHTVPSSLDIVCCQVSCLLTSILCTLAYNCVYYFHIRRCRVVYRWHKHCTYTELDQVYSYRKSASTTLQMIT